MNGSEVLSLSEELQLLEKEYTAVAMTTLASLQHNKIPTSHIYQHILNLPQQNIRSKYKKLAERCAKSLTSMATMQQVFLKFSPYCDFLNPDMLEHIVDRFGDELSCAIISLYIKRIKAFRRKTLLCDMPGKWVGLTPAGYTEIQLQLDDKWRKKSLEDLEVFRSHHTRAQWFLKSVRGEGQEVAFSVPKGVWLYQDDLEGLRKSGVVCVSESRRKLVELRTETRETSKVSSNLHRSRSLDIYSSDVYHDSYMEQEDYTGEEGQEDYMNNDEENHLGHEDWGTDMTFVLPREIQFGFHKQAGDNIFVSRSTHRAMRMDQAGRVGLVYTERPLTGLTELEVRLVDYSSRVGSSLKMGLMRRRATTMDRTVSMPKLAEHRDNSCAWFKSWYKPKTEFQNNFSSIHILQFYGYVNLGDLKQDDRIGLQLSAEGELSFFVNGMSQGVAAYGVYDSQYDVYGFIELVEGHRAVELTRAVTRGQE